MTPLIKAAEKQPPREAADKIRSLKLRNCNCFNFVFFKIFKCGLVFWCCGYLVPDSELALRLLPLLAPVKLGAGCKNRPTTIEALTAARDSFISDITVICFVFCFVCWLSVRTFFSNLGRKQHQGWMCAKSIRVYFEVIGAGMIFCFNHIVWLHLIEIVF